MPHVTACIYTCWSMGSVKDRCIHYKKVGDQFFGCSLTGISSLTKEFDVSPSYFELENEPLGTTERMKSEIEENLVRKHQLNPYFFAMLHSLNATLYFHREFLDEFLHSQSSI